MALTRRTFLQGLGAVAALLAVPAPLGAPVHVAAPAAPLNGLVLHQTFRWDMAKWQYAFFYAQPGTDRALWWADLGDAPLTPEGEAALRVRASEAIRRAL